MPAIIGFAFLIFVVGVVTGGVIGGLICYKEGKAQEAKKWKKEDEWKKEDATSYN